jgi:Lsr2 protein
VNARATRAGSGPRCCAAVFQQAGNPLQIRRPGDLVFVREHQESSEDLMYHRSPLPGCQVLVPGRIPTSGCPGQTGGPGGIYRGRTRIQPPADADRGRAWAQPRIRAWAKGQGIAVSDRGRIPESVIAHYEAASRDADPRPDCGAASHRSGQRAIPQSRSRNGRHTGRRGSAAGQAVGALGASPDEARASLPGGDVVPHATGEVTRAVTVGAPPEAVWPWLAHMGCGRAGWYTYP